MPQHSNFLWEVKIEVASRTFIMWGFPGGPSGEEPACQYRRFKRHGFDPWVRKILCRRAWQPIPVFLPGESHGPRSLGGYGPWGCTEADTTKVAEHTQPNWYKQQMTAKVNLASLACIMDTWYLIPARKRSQIIKRKIKTINIKCSRSHKMNQSKSVLHQTEPWKSSSPNTTL